MGAFVAVAVADGEVGGAVAPDDEELHPAASTEEISKTMRVPQTVAPHRGQRKRSAESFIPVIPSALLQVSDSEQWVCPVVTP